MTRHPANRGQVALMAWVPPELRERVRRAARADGMALSRWVEAALDEAATATERMLDLPPMQEESR